MAFESKCLSARGCIPHLYRVVKAAADDSLPVRAETHARYRARVTFESERHMARCGFPYFQRLVVATADNSVAIPAYIQAHHTA